MLININIPDFNLEYNDEYEDYVKVLAETNSYIKEIDKVKLYILNIKKEVRQKLNNLIIK